jgi:hypothetical protein
MCANKRERELSGQKLVVSETVARGTFRQCVFRLAWKMYQPQSFAKGRPMARAGEI